MQDILYQYLVLHQQLSLPGVGLLEVNRHSAQYNFANKEFSAPAYSFRLTTDAGKPSDKLFNWLSHYLSISEWEAIKKVNDFSFDLKNHASASEGVVWDKVGVMRRNESGSIILESLIAVPGCEQPVPAEKVVREHAEHTLLVGEKETTSWVMEELLVVKEKRRDWNWIVAVIITIVALMLAGLYFSEKGLNPTSTGNRSVIQAK